MAVGSGQWAAGSEVLLSFIMSSTNRKSPPTAYCPLPTSHCLLVFILSFPIPGVVRAGYIQERLHFVGEAEKVNESLCFFLVVYRVLCEGCEIFAVKRVGRFPAGDDYIAFIELQPHRSCHSGLNGIRAAEAL